MDIKVSKIIGALPHVEDVTACIEFKFTNELTFSKLSSGNQSLNRHLTLVIDNDFLSETQEKPEDWEDGVYGPFNPYVNAWILHYDIGGNPLRYEALTLEKLVDGDTVLLRLDVVGEMCKATGTVVVDLLDMHLEESADPTEIPHGLSMETLFGGEVIWGYQLDVRRKNSNLRVSSDESPHPPSHSNSSGKYGKRRIKLSNK